MLTQKKLLTLDGGMGTLLYREHGIERDPKIWLLRALTEKTNHEKVVEAHQRYLSAGADVILTFNYPAVPMFVEQLEDGLARLPELIATAGRLACRAVETF